MTDQPPSPPIPASRRFHTLIKPGIISFLVLASLIPLQSIRGLVLERQATGRQVAADIAESWGGEQRIAGPILVLPVSPGGAVIDESVASGFQTARDRAARYLIVLPKTLTVDGTMMPRIRRRGIYEAPLYSMTMTMAGGFTLPDFAALGVDEARDVLWQDARVVLFASDLGGFVDAPNFEWNGQTRTMRAGDAEQSIAVASVPTPRPGEFSWPAPFALDFTINGSGSFGLIPIAEQTSMILDSPWEHPGFLGAYLPTESQIDEDGFRASWDLLHFARGMAGASLSVTAVPNWLRERAVNDAVLTRLVTPVDHYLMSERSVKYGLLFVILVSCVLFVFEILSDARIHPVQYAMVAAALCLFFLMLLSLSEVIGFAGGYLIAAALTVGLLAVYVGAIARSAKRGGVLGGLLGLVYGYMFVTLVSEDHALLLGSVLLFVALGTAMLATRQLDWYALGERLPGTAKSASEETVIPSG
jgi:inner membrane protein